MEREWAYYRALLLPRMRSFAGLMTVFWLIAGVAHAWAADHVVSGNSAKLPLKASTDANIIRTIDLLRKQADENGKTRIIVGLRVDFAAEGGLTAEAAAQQRNEIAKAQSAVLEKVPSLKLGPRQIKRFTVSPFMALEVNKAELEALVSLTEIASIEEDRLAEPTSGIGVPVPEKK